MKKDDKHELLAILGYKPKSKKSKKIEKTASLKTLGLGTAIGASLGASKGYSKISENPDLSSEDKGIHATVPTIGGAIAGATVGGIAVPKAKKSLINAAKKVKGLFKTSEFLDELVMIKEASMNIPSEDEIKETKNVSQDDDVIDGFPESTQYCCTDSDNTLQNAKERKTDVSDFGPYR